MRFDALTLERYGHFAEQPLDLGADGRLIVVLGPNEAGKTTILQAIRDLVFGMPHRSDYNFRFGYDGMRVHGTLRAADQARLEVTRSRGRGRTLEGQRRMNGHAEALDDAGWEALLGGMSRERYEALFAITLADLQEGSEALERLGLAQILAGGALGRGGRRVVQVRDRLIEEMDALFTPRAQKKPINELLRRLRDAEKEKRDARLSRTAWEELRRDEEDARRRHKELVRRAADLEARVRTRERWLDALVDVERLHRLDAELGEARFDVSLATGDARQILDELADVAADEEVRSGLDRKLDRLTEKIDVLTPDPRLLDEGKAIEALVRGLEATRERRERLPERQDELSAEREAIRAEAERLLPVSDVEGLVAWGPDAAKRERLEHLAERHEALADGLGEVRRRLKAAQAGIEEEDSALEALGEASVDESLAGLADEVEAVRDDHTDWRRSVEEAEGLRGEVARRRASLHPAWPESGDPESAALPGREDVRIRTEEGQSLEREREQARGELEDARGELRRVEDELARLLREREPPTRKELGAAREARDDLWGDVESAWLDGVEPERAPRELARDYRTSVDEADDVADRLRAAAEDVASREHLEGQRARAEARVGEGEAALGAADEAVEAWRSRWEGFWSDLGVEAGPPAVMAEWLDAARELQVRARRAAEAEDRAATLRERLEPVEKRLRTAIGEGEDASWPALTGALSRRLAEQRDRATKRELAEARRAEHEKALRTEQRREAELDRTLDDIAGEAARLAEAIGFDDRPEVPDLLRRVEHAEQLAARARGAVALEDDVRRLGEALAAFDEEVGRLLSTLDRDAQGRPAEVMVERLHEGLSAARDQQARREAAREELVGLREEREEVVERVESSKRRLAERREQAGAADDEALAELAERALERGELEAERAGIDDRLTQRLGAGEARDEALSALAESSRETLEAEVRTLREDELAEVTRARDQVAEELGVLRERMDTLGGDVAARAAAEAEEARSELEEHAATWLRLSAARLVLDRVVERYAAEHQGSLLEHTSRVFERLTGGRYARVVQPLGRDAILVEPADGSLAKEPGALSTGTREQLFLALRLAYVLEHAEQHEPLPVVLDDVLVNFDPERTEAALRTLVEVGETCQVILLTCHPHVARSAEAQGDGVRVLTLDGEPAQPVQ